MILMSNEALASHATFILHHAGRRLELRPFRSQDVGALTLALQVSISELRSFSPWALGPVNEASSSERIREWARDFAAGTSYELGMFLQEELVGGVALGAHTPNPRCLDISVWTSTPRARQGYATLALRSAVVLAFDRLGALRVQMSHDVRNGASAALAERCGFQREGVCRGLTRLGKTASEYKAVGDAVLYGMLPEDVRDTAWYRELANALQQEQR